jgi:hypothetical protein
LISPKFASSEEGLINEIVKLHKAKSGKEFTLEDLMERKKKMNRSSFLLYIKEALIK